MRKNQRSGFIYGLVAVGLITSLVSLTDKAQAASGNGPYYATPSWDQKLPAATRFVVLTDWNSEAVLDRETGLVWEQQIHSGGSWQEIACWDRAIGGRRGWRLPTIPELLTLVDPAQSNPALPPGHPFNLIFNGQFKFWSSETWTALPTYAYFVNMSDGFVNAMPKPGIGADTPDFWCVRGGTKR